MGVGPDVLVGVCLERSIDMIVGLLGIMKAGGAYLPLDPAYPKERLAYMVDDAGVAALLTQQSLIATLPTGPLLRTICLDTESHLDTEEREDNPERQTKAGHLAYVIYTSGSTGKPKGVQIQNSGLMNLISWFQATNELTSNDRISHLAGVAFDANMIELWPTLTVGAHLYIPTEEVRSSPTKLKDWLAERAITISFLPTPVAEQALRAPWPETTALRALQTGGDKLHRVTGANLPFKLTNLYGPTETTVVATWAPVFTGADQEIDPPIGRPLANTQIYLWDESLQPVPIGVPGEVHIGGAGVARGYLNRAQLTAEKFIPDPYSDIPGGRLYRTGDLARYLSDGSIEYLGRLDNQVKLRGFRIELGEIEAALNGHDAVREAVVIDREDVPGEKRLVAYLVVHQPAPATDQLRAFLKASLPEYMVPAVFVFLDELPLTVNGKLDRRALPAPAHGGHGLTTHYTAPRDAIEVAVARIFAEALGIDRIGIEDDFFELGGHSLLATQVVSRLLDIFGLEIRLRALFETPTIAGIAQAVAKHERLPEWISKNGAKLLNIDNEKPPSTEADDSSRLKATESGRAWQPTARIPRRGSEDPELSFAQQRLWLLDQLQPGTSLYNVPLPIRMKGSLDQRALAESLSEIIRRHESLRTVFPAVAGQPAQVILPPPPSSGAELSIIDLLAADELSDDFRSATAIGEERLQRLIEQESQRPFDLATGPLVRTLLVRVAEDEHLLLLTMHHIVTDGWSLRVLMGELGELYKTFSKDHHESPLAELPIQYTDYAIWQRQWLQGGALQEQMLYWQEQLQGAPALLELPTDHPRPPVQSFRGGFHTFTLPARLARQLRALGQQEGASLFMTLLAAFKVLLWRYSGQEQIVVGMPIANRKRVEVESLIGFFVNTLALSSKVSGELGFRELLRQVKETALGAYAHQDAPFEKLVEVLQPDRSLSYHPIFQVFFTFDTGSSSTLELPDLTLLPLDVGNGASKFDLALSLKETNGALRGSLEYSKDLFEQATIERMVRHLEILLESIVSEPERQLSTLGMLSGSEINQVLMDWNSTQSSYPDELCVHELFETQVVETPDAVAVIFQDQALTYAELNTRANQLAHRLQELGVGPDSLVGICVKPSLKMVVGVLGILKAGGAYVPLDAGYPVERLGFMMEDAGMSVLITESDLVTGLPVHRGQTLCLDTEWDLVSEESSANPESAVRGENLAYVIYTSGSTGRPKGVMIQHRGVVNYLSWAIQTYSPTAGHGAPLHSSLSFDLSVTSMFIPLLTGRCLRLLSHDHNVEALSSALKTTPDYTLVKLTPAHLQLLDEQMSAAEKKGASRALVVGGENLTWEMIRRWRDGAPETRIYNEYGPTETVVGSSIYEVGEEEAPRSGSVPIGRPIANTQLYILSKELEPVAAGVSGELYIGGAGLARGYLGRPELTAERFVPHPFSVSGGERMYRTGDLARYGADGRIEYLGRIDHQVKLRGYRIELGEIEAALSSHGSVREAAVILREDMPGDKRLVAYLVTDHLGPSVVELREYLKERLPEYMVPAAFVPLEELPLTPNGKLDRAALPAPESKGGEVDARQAARTPIEEVVAGIWSQVLGRERVRAEENFFELGGHSLLATQVMSRLRQSLQIDLPLRTLFECPTVRALAASIETTMRAADRSTQAPPIRSVSRDQLLPLSFSQQRLWFIDQLEPNQSHFNSPVAMRLNGSLSVKALADALAEIIRRHEILRTTFTSVGGQPCQIIAPATGVNLPVIDLDLLAPDKREVEAQRWVDEEAQRPFDLGCGPLLRMTLLRMAEHDHILILTKHHIITDGWSINVFVDELAQLYIAFANGEPSPLPELAIQYADHAIWQREWLQGEVLEQQLSYWRRHLAGAPAVLNLPLDRPRPAVQSLRGATHQRTISPELTRALRQLSQQEGCTLFMTLLALLKTLLFYYSAQEQIVVGTDVANRNQMESERLCGLFINHLVLNTEMSGDPTFSELLARVREVALGAYAHQDVPFEKVVEALKPERASSHSPLFQVLCVVQNTPGREFELPGLTVRPVEFQWATAKYDLGLFAEESPEGLVLGWNYKTDLFNSHTIDRIALGFEALLQAVTANREQHLSGLLALLADLHEQQRTTEEQGFVAQSALKFKTIRRKAVSRN
ncbi:MAG: amino acid adenylation domain-containing protein [Pyrinomonadaceae bacterium]|nr:amino acid adenylation domain-containing protein [Pyrinomonadaceae bacterium]